MSYISLTAVKGTAGAVAAWVSYIPFSKSSRTYHGSSVATRTILQRSPTSATARNICPAGKLLNATGRVH